MDATGAVGAGTTRDDDGGGRGVVGRAAGAARARVLVAAEQLFVREGVAGTSLQMIADAVGVTKAAVYHQFSTKEAILAEVLRPALEDTARVVAVARRPRSAQRRFDAALEGLVDLAVRRGDVAGLLRRDPAAAALVAEDEGFRAAAAGLDELLIGPDPTPAARIALAVAGAGLVVAGSDPALRGVDLEPVLRGALHDSVRRVLLPHRPRG